MSFMIQAPQLSAVPGLVHGFLTRQGGASQGDWASNNCALCKGDSDDTVHQNRAHSLQRVGLDPATLCLLNQVHGTRVVTVHDTSTHDNATKADAMITTARHVTLGILTADCCPVLIAHREGCAVAAVHAGWRGAAAGIIPATLAGIIAMGFDPRDLIAVVGPAIAQGSFEVSADVRDTFLARNQAWNRFFQPSPQPEHFLCDLPGLVCDDLREQGVSASWVELDTYDHPDLFFSYRRKTHRQEASFGCQMSLIGLT